MAEAVKPVIAEVPSDRGGDPQRDAAQRGIEPFQRHIDERQVTHDETPAEQRQEFREIPGRRVEHAGADAVDRIIATIHPGLLVTINKQFDDDREQEKRYGTRNQVHARSLR